MTTLPLKISTLEVEGAFQASKWSKLQVLISIQELQALFKTRPSIRIFSIRGIVEKTAIETSQEHFIQSYARWIKKLQEGEVPSREDLNTITGSVMTEDLDALYLLKVNDSYLVKPRKPVVLVQAHFMGYSQSDHLFRPMIHGENTLFWGLQFSYPQIFQCPETRSFVKVDKSESFRNTDLFHSIRKWLREVSRPTPFIINGKKINIPMRLGKDCFSWIKAHKQLQEQGLVIDVD